MHRAGRGHHSWYLLCKHEGLSLGLQCTGKKRQEWSCQSNPSDVAETGKSLGAYEAGSLIKGRHSKFSERPFLKKKRLRTIKKDIQNHQTSSVLDTHMHINPHRHVYTSMWPCTCNTHTQWKNIWYHGLLPLLGESNAREEQKGELPSFKKEFILCLIMSFCYECVIMWVQCP